MLKSLKSSGKSLFISTEERLNFCFKKKKKKKKKKNQKKKKKKKKHQKKIYILKVCHVTFNFIDFQNSNLCYLLVSPGFSGF